MQFSTALGWVLLCSFAHVANSQCQANYYGLSVASCVLCPANTTSASNSASITDCKCAPGYTGADGGPCTVCGVGFYKSTIGSAACTDCSVSSSCQCAAGSTGVVGTSPSVNSTRDAVLPNYCTDTNGAHLMKVVQLVPYAVNSFIVDACIPSQVRNVMTNSTICSFTIIAYNTNENNRVFLYDRLCTDILVGDGHIRVILNDTLAPIMSRNPGNTATLGKVPAPFNYAELGWSHRVFMAYYNRTRTCENQGIVCACSGNCFRYCTTATLTTDHCHTNWLITGFSYVMRLANPPHTIGIIRQNPDQVRVTWGTLYLLDRGFGSSPPTTQHPINAIVVELDTTPKFNETTRITAFCLPGVINSICDYDARFLVVSGLNATQNYFVRVAARTILGNGNSHGPFLSAVANTEVAFLTNQRCENCFAGTYKPSLQSFHVSCTNCSAGKYSIDTGATSVNTCLDCFPGTSSPTTGLSTCLTCSAGTFSSVLAATVCTTCAVNSFSANGASTCTCNAGSTGSDALSCVLCAAGKYKTVTGTGPCIDCPLNSYSNVVGATTASTCTSCALYSETSSTGQTNISTCLCMPGSTGPAGGPCTPFVCLPGTTGPDAQSCVSCPAGTYKKDLGSAPCTTCPAGSNSLAGSTSLANCSSTISCPGLCRAPAGYKVTSSGVNIEACQANEYNNGSAKACTTCPWPETFTTATGLTSLTQCTCRPGFTRLAGVCTACAPNTYKTEAGDGLCTTCPVNTTSPAGSSLLSSCQCNTGYTGSDGGPCLACTVSTYKTAVGSATCSACPSNSVSPTGSTLLTSCQCNAGYTGSDGGPCSVCPVSTYKTTVGSANCSACPQNSVSPNGSTLVTSCQCNAGFQQDNGTCTACAMGFYKAEVGSGFCTVCPANTVTTSTGQAACVCKVGSYASPGLPAGVQLSYATSSVENVGCTLCYDQPYSHTTTTSIIDNCKMLAGSGWVVMGAKENSNATTLSLMASIKAVDLVTAFTTISAYGPHNGAYWYYNPSYAVGFSLAQSIYLMNTDILSGQCEYRLSWSLSIGGARAGCTTGLASNTVWRKIMYYCPKPSDVCVNCPAGKYSMTVGATNASTCVDCAAGKYSETLGASQPATCLDCAPGSYAPTSGMSSCTPCPANSVSPSGSSLLTSCQCNAGYTGSDGGPCSVCAVSTYKTAVGSATCSACPPNSVSPTGSTLSTSCQCIAGYTGMNGDACSLCPAGTFKTDTGSAQCSGCPLNSLSPAGSTAKSACLCNAGYETSLDGSGVILACSACPTGKYKATAGSASGCRLCESDLPFSTGAFDSASPYCVCRPGYVLDAGACRACQKGTYKENQGNSTLDCATLLGGCCACGQFQTTTSAGSAVALTDCVCLHGHGVADPNNFACMPCPRGTYKEGMDRQACAACPAGTSTGEVGAFEARECVSRAGYYMVFGLGGLGTAHACANGTYSDYLNATACEPCFFGATSPPASESIDACVCRHPYTASGEAHDCTCGAGFALA